MPEIVLRYWVDNDNEVGLEECLDFIQNNDLSGPGESDIVTVFDNEGKIYYHNHGYSPVDQSYLYPYPEHCVEKYIMGDLARGCNFDEIQKTYREEMLGEKNGGTTASG